MSHDRSVGMPKGIPYIIGNEAAERFSYYGMKAILVVFMTGYLRMNDNDATIWLHTFGIGVYATPLIGALLSDLVFGKYKTIMSLSIVYCLGHLVLALFETQNGLAAGLTLIAIGSGGIKPCVSAHVGDQFGSKNKHLIERVFSYFYLSINLGAFISTLATPFLLQIYGPSVAFGVPGLLMFIATFIFWLGRKKFIAIRPMRNEFLKDIKSRRGIKCVLTLSVIYVFIAVFWALFDQTASTWVLQAKSSFMDKSVDIFGFSFTLLPAQIQAANPLFILLFTPLFTFLVYPLFSRFGRVKPMWKITVGMFIAALSFVIVGYAEGLIQNGITVSIMWQFVAFAILTAAEVMVSITALEFSYTQAPNSMKSFIMGLYMLSVSLGNSITTVVNKFIIKPIEVENVITGKNTAIEVKNAEDYIVGQKINIDQLEGVYLDAAKETALNGTFIIEKIDTESGLMQVIDVERKGLETFGETKSFEKAELSTFKLTGSNYFYFFAALMCGTAVLFIILAIFYREEVYIQSEEDIE
ncbi:MAG: POT family MFS transporter [Chitinophagales bacterium]